MSPTQITAAETDAMPHTTLVSLVAAVTEDPKALASRVKASVQRSQEDANSCMSTGPENPVLRLTRITLDADGQPIQVDTMTMPTHRQRLCYEIRLG